MCVPVCVTFASMALYCFGASYGMQRAGVCAHACSSVTPAVTHRRDPSHLAALFGACAAAVLSMLLASGWQGRQRQVMTRQAGGHYRLVCVSCM